MQFFRKDGRDNLEILIGLLGSDLLDHHLSVLKKVVVHGLDEGLSEFIARTFRTARIAGLKRFQVSQRPFARVTHDCLTYFRGLRRSMRCLGGLLLKIGVGHRLTGAAIGAAHHGGFSHNAREIGR